MLFICLLFFGITFSQTFDTKGKRLLKTANKTRNPKTIVDTVKMSAGIGFVVLNVRFQRGRSSVKASSNKHLFATITQILNDTSETVNYYAYYASKKGDSLIIKSNSNTDTSLVVVKIFVR
jgi:hypothetical protein